MKRVAVIPVVPGVTDIPDRDALLVDGSPMLFPVVQACQEAAVFEKIYVSADVPLYRTMAGMLGVWFIERPPDRGGTACQASAWGDNCGGGLCRIPAHAVPEALVREECAVVVVSPAAPLLRPQTIRAFADRLVEGRYDALVAVEERTAPLGETEPSSSGTDVCPRTSSESAPIRFVSSALSGWNAAALREANGDQVGAATAVARRTKTGTFLISRTEALTAEMWEDLYLIEACLQHRRQQERPGQFRFMQDVVSIERCAEDIIKRDGVKRFEASGANARLSNLEEIKRRMGEAPWDYLLVFSQTDQTGMICQRPGESVRKHAHMTHAEWWLVLQGEFEWRFGDGAVVRAKAMELVTAPRGLIHTITCVSDVPGIRLACGARDMEHVYYRP